jgi:hypothetical protein
VLRSFLDWRGRRQYCKSVAGSLPLPRELPLPQGEDDEMPWPGGVRFYAGVPLASPAGVVVGALSVLDSRAEAQLSAAKQALLRRLARQGRLAARVVPQPPPFRPRFLPPPADDVAALHAPRATRHYFASPLAVQWL